MLDNLGWICCNPPCKAERENADWSFRFQVAALAEKMKLMAAAFELLSERQEKDAVVALHTQAVTASCSAWDDGSKFPSLLSRPA